REKANSPLSSSPATSSRPRLIASRSSAPMIPWAASMSACARLPSMSSAAMRRSKSIEALMASIAAEGPAAKRPPHIVFAEAVAAGFPPGARLLWSVKIAPDSRENRPMRVPLALAALLYGLTALSANAEGLDDRDRAAQEALRTGDVEKVVLHEEPRAPIAEAFQDADGNELTLADFAGRVVLLNLWATWCPPCRAGMPSIDRLAGEIAGDGLAVIALSSDRGG